MNIVKLLTLNKKVKKQAGGNVVTVTMPKGNKVLLDRSSKEYTDLYNSGKLMNKVDDDSYVAPSLKPVEIITSKDPTYKPYTKQQFIKDRAGVLGNLVDPNNMSTSMEQGYNQEIIDRSARKILDRLPKLDNPNNRLKWLKNFTPAELEAVKKSKYNYEVATTGMQDFKNFGILNNPLKMGRDGITSSKQLPIAKGTTMLEAKEAANNFSSVLEPLNIPAKLVQSAYKKDYTLIDALNTKRNDAGVIEDIITDGLATAGLSGVGKLAKGLANVGKFGKIGNFKSEINWAKWNEEIPKNKPLMQEYNAIEQQAKVDGTWMKNTDGTIFNGTPEQFVQQNSENFKKAYPNGHINVFRGSHEHNPLFKNKGTFTANKKLAEGYADNLSKFYTPKSKREEVGVYNLAHKKSDNNIELHFNQDSWTELPLLTKQEIVDMSEKNLRDYIKYLKANKKINSAQYEFNKNAWGHYVSPRRESLNKLRKSKDNNPIVLKKLKDRFGNKASTDQLATYTEDSDIDFTKLNNINDGGIGDVTIVNNKQGNYLKSLIGNNGMFDMTNPNIYKGLIPATIGAKLYQQNFTKDKPVIQKTGGKRKYKFI